MRKSFTYINVMLNSIQHRMGERQRSPESRQGLRKSFTLAEVLITLGIIGVVASITIPTLMNNKAKQETATKLEKIYSTLTQAKQMAIQDTGLQVNQWFTSDVTCNTGACVDKFVNTYIVPYLHIVNNCRLSTTGDCSGTIRYLTPSLGYDNNAYSAYNSKFYITDGTFISFGTYYFDASNGGRFSITIDINGQAKPNIYGKDVFVFFLFETGKIIPSGFSYANRTSNLNDTSWGCNKNGGTGPTCTALIIQDGWQIKDDYPW